MKIDFSLHQLEVLSELKVYIDFSLKPFWKRWFAPLPFKGIYLYGPPGGGKTTLMRYFLGQLTTPYKKLDHFHTFMFDFHQNKKPFKTFVKDMKKQTHVLCLVEFFIDNIADAMILERFLKECVKNNIFIFLTSNCAPDNLYAKGLHRDRFLSCIDFIHKNFNVMKLDADEDYRKYEIWDLAQKQTKLTYQDFFEKPLGTREYLYMAQMFDEIKIYDCPKLSVDHLDSLKRLIVCTDIFYVQKKQIKIPLDIWTQIDQMKDKLDGLERTLSRLKSMMDMKND